MKTSTLLAFLVLGLGCSGLTQAADFTFSFSGSPYSGTGTISATDDGGGNFTATSGTFVLNTGLTLYLDPVPSGSSIVTIHNIGNTSGLDLFGDNDFTLTLPSSDGLVFTNPALNGNQNVFPGDVVNIWGDGGSTGTLYAAGPDFAFNGVQEDGTVTIGVIPEPSTYALLLGGLGLLAFVTRRTGRLQS